VAEDFVHRVGRTGRASAHGVKKSINPVKEMNF
jgi:superfamily II DNA/RNA helicase